MLVFFLIISSLHDVAALCKTYATNYEGSEDVSLWKNGIIFASCGMEPVNPNDQGGMLAVDLSGEDPQIHDMTLLNMPAGFQYRPHGIYIDNATDRVFVINHDPMAQRER